MSEIDLDKKLAKIREDVAELAGKAHKDIKKAKLEKNFFYNLEKSEKSAKRT